MDEDQETPAIERLDHKVKAKMDLSGSDIHVGAYCHPQGESLFIKTDEMVEPIYFTIAEDDLLVAAIRAAQDYLKEDTRAGH